MNERYREIEVILDECLELLAQGKTQADCLAAYPEQASELEPLLEAALAVRKAISIKPDASFKARARYQLRAVMAEKVEKKRFSFFGWRPRGVVAVASLLLALVVSSGGVAAAASNSMPDDFLYPVKLATEQVMLNLALSPEGKAKRYMDMADERVAEIVYLAGKGDIKGMEAATNRLGGYLSIVAEITLPDDIPASNYDSLATENGNMGQKFQYQYHVSDETVGIMQSCAESHQAMLEEAMETASPTIRAQLQKALDAVIKGYQNALGTAGK